MSTDLETWRVNGAIIRQRGEAIQVETPHNGNATNSLGSTHSGDRPGGRGKRGGGREVPLAGDRALVNPEGGPFRHGGEAGQAGLATGGRGWKELRGAGQSPRIMRVACRVAAKPLVLPILALL